MEESSHLKFLLFLIMNIIMKKHTIHLKIGFCKKIRCSNHIHALGSALKN